MSHFWLNFLWPGTTVSGSPQEGRLLVQGPACRRCSQCRPMEVLYSACSKCSVLTLFSVPRGTGVVMSHRRQCC